MTEKKKRWAYKKTTKLNTVQKAELRALIKARISASIAFANSNEEERIIDISLITNIVTTKRELNAFIRTL